MNSSLPGEVVEADRRRGRGWEEGERERGREKISKQKHGKPVLHHSWTHTTVSDPSDHKLKAGASIYHVTKWVSLCCCCQEYIVRAILYWEISLLWANWFDTVTLCTWQKRTGDWGTQKKIKNLIFLPIKLNAKSGFSNCTNANATASNWPPCSSFKVNDW